MSASKNRPRWSELPLPVRQQIEDLAGGRVVAAESCEGGFSPGFASRLTLASGRRAFAKAMDAAAWPFQATMHADEARVAARLPDGLPTPRFRGWTDDGQYVILVFDCADGAEPARPWRAAELAQVAGAISRFSQSVTPSPVRLLADQPRIGGWSELASDAAGTKCAGWVRPWAAARADWLAELESAGLQAAQGDTLVHFDALPHNILRTDSEVLLVDWPHARLGAPYIDLLMVLASAAGDGLDPEPVLQAQPVGRDAGPAAIDGVLAALTGFWLAGGLAEPEPGLEPIYAAKLALGRGSAALASAAGGRLTGSRVGSSPCPGWVAGPPIRNVTREAWCRRAHRFPENAGPHRPPGWYYQYCVVAPELLTMPPPISGGSYTDWTAMRPGPCSTSQMDFACQRAELNQ